VNILSLDFDSGVSDVNISNRLWFMIKNASDQLKSDGADIHHSDNRKILSQAMYY
jgi:hypothetical protein